MDKAQMYQCLYNNICYLRSAKGLTQKEMAKIIGISVSTLSRMESGASYPRICAQMLCRVCDYFDISADVMIKCDLEAEGLIL